MRPLLIIAIVLLIALFFAFRRSAGPDYDLLQRHLGSLDRSKATRIETDFESAREWTAWFYVEAPKEVVTDLLSKEGFKTGTSQAEDDLKWISGSTKMPRLPKRSECRFFTYSPNDRGVMYKAVTDEVGDRVWILAMRY